MVYEVNDGNFEEEVLRSSIPVAVDFWGPWCAPCIAMEPVIKKLAEEYHGKVKFCKLNVGENPKTTARYEITSIPRILFFKDGKVVDSILGKNPSSEIEKVLLRIIHSS